MLQKAEYCFDKLADWIGHACGILMIAMMVNVFYNVIMRYFFKTGSIGFQELEWHFFSLIIFYGISYALKDDAHVCVDIFYEKFEPKTKALVNMVGAVVFILPISLLIATGSTDFVLEAYSSNEGSPDPGGLSHRWLIKAMIPLAFYLLVFMTLGFILKNLNRYIACSAKKGA